MKDQDRLRLYDSIALNEGAYFFKKGSLKITKRLINDVFSMVLEDNCKKLAVIIRTNELFGEEPQKTAIVSLLVFKNNSFPNYFNFDGDIPKELIEEKIGYLLIAEIQQYVIIVKKNISHLTPFIEQLEPIDANTLCSVMVDDQSVYQQVRLTNMNMSVDAMRNKSYEANNLRNSMPTFNSNQLILNATKFLNSSGLCSINVATSRLAKFGEKKSIRTLLIWMNTIVEYIEAGVQQSSFFNLFAMPVSWKNKREELTPASILIDKFMVRDFLDKLNDHDLYYGDAYVSIGNRAKTFLQQLECISLTEKNGCYSTYNGKLIILKNTNGISIRLNGLLNNIYYREDDGVYRKIVNLLRVLNCFSVSFTDCHYVYYGRRLYNNNNIFNDLKGILSVMKTCPNINRMMSEKGNNLLNNSTEFVQDSMFGVVENQLFADADYLICDDLGWELADHIAVKDNTISLIHSKCSDKVGFSASSFQEVIGQAIKNIGNLRQIGDIVENKRATWDSNWGNTRIARCRRGSVDGIIDRIMTLKTNPNRVYEVCLAVNFISKSDLENAFSHIIAGENFAQKNVVVQLVWILNGFISNCKDADMHCKIFCRE